jgi:hypothetical protein
MGQSHPCNKDKQRGENGVSQHDPLHRHQALPGLLLYSKYLLNQLLTLNSYLLILNSSLGFAKNS